MSKHTPIMNPEDGVGMLLVPIANVHLHAFVGTDCPLSVYEAAPNLLEACKGLLVEIECCIDDGSLMREAVDSNDAVIDARAAIAKARGE